MSDAMQRISKMRTMLILDHPFFGALSLRLKVTRDERKTKDMATDGRHLYYSEKYVDSLPDDELLGMLAHLVMHPAMQHHTRRGHRKDKTWQKACDLAINTPLMEAGFKLPMNVPVDPRHSGQSAEAIYSVLEQQESDDQDDDQDDQQNDQQQQGTPPPGSGDGDGDGQGDGDGSDGNGQGNAPGSVLDAEDPAQDGAEWQMAVKQAALAAKAMGNLPADLARLVEEANRPRYDWRSLLMRFAQDQCKADYSWRMPNRRYMQQGLYLPEINDTQMGEMIIAIDSSGSIDDTTMSKFLGAIEGVAEQVKPRAIKVVICDARVHVVHEFQRDEPIENVKLVGGGGTDFCPVFDMIDASDDRPACVMYLTDGYGRFPDQPCDSPTLWVMTSEVQAPWGETVRLETDEER